MVLIMLSSLFSVTLSLFPLMLLVVSIYSVYISSFIFPVLAYTSFNNYVFYILSFCYFDCLL